MCIERTGILELISASDVSIGSPVDCVSSDSFGLAAVKEAGKERNVLWCSTYGWCLSLILCFYRLIKANDSAT